MVSDDQERKRPEFGRGCSLTRLGTMSYGFEIRFRNEGQGCQVVRGASEEAPEESRSASFRRLHALIGIPIDTMRTWVTRAEVDAGNRPGVTTSENEEMKRLRKENAELRRANEILKTAALRRISLACLSSRFSRSKIGGWIKRSTRRIVIHLPADAPWRPEWLTIANCVLAPPRA